MTNGRSTTKGGWRALAALVGLAMVGTGLVATPALAATETAPGVNPMGAATPVGSDNGYTIFVKEDALFANAELEGSVAVGGVATFDKNGSDYAVVHQAAGNADYALPTLDGQPNRLLLQELGSGAKAVVKLQERNSPHAGTVGTAKIFNQAAPANFSVQDKNGTPTFARTGDNHSAPQVWVAGSSYSASAMDIEGTFASKFPATDPGAILASYDAYATPQPYVANNGSDWVELEDGPNLVRFADFNGTQGFLNLKDAGGDNFLVVKVAQSDVKNGALKVPTLDLDAAKAPGAAVVSSLLFDLSEVTGDVELQPGASAIRGSFYAPNAKLVYASGANLEGQVVAKEFSAPRGNEIHTNLFKGRFPAPEPTEPITPPTPPTPAPPAPPVEEEEFVVPEGTFTLQKSLSGLDASAFPAGTTFPVTATWDGGSKTFQVPADGTQIPSGLTLARGTVVTLTEDENIAVPGGYTFLGNTAPQTITILADDNPNIAWTITNTYEPITPTPPTDPTNPTDPTDPTEPGAPNSLEPPNTSDETTPEGSDKSVPVDPSKEEQPAEEPQTTEGAELAKTGFGSSGILLVGGVLLAAGGAALVVGRRRRSA